MASRFELESQASIRVGILTVSDTCFYHDGTDRSGANLHSLIEDRKILPRARVVAQAIVPDEVDAIESKLVSWCDELALDLVLTSGGTGMSPRDVTPEATRKVIEKEAVGMTIAMIKGSIELTPLAMLSRPVCGSRGGTLIVNLPGSKKASAECLDFILMAIPHVIDLLQGNRESIKNTHTRLQQNGEHLGRPSKQQPPRVPSAKSKVEVAKAALRARESPYELFSVETALNVVLTESEALKQIEEVESSAALNRVLAESVTALDPLPPFEASIKDGYAVIASECPGRLTVAGDSNAGDAPDAVTVRAGYCARINTGAPVPAGADAVVQVEDTKLAAADECGKEELEVVFLKPVKKSQDIRAKGSDIAAGQTVLQAGSTLTPCELGLLATVGVTRVQTYRLPVVGVLSTGDELVEPDVKPLPEGKIRDANRTTLLNLFKDKGIPTVDLGVALDSPDDLLSALLGAANSCDVIVSTGGVSMGERDYLKRVLETDLEAKLHFGRVYMKPGKPTTFATWNFEGQKKLFFGLPGNPVSAAVTANLFVLPACRLAAGWRVPRTSILRARLAAPVKLDPRPEFHRCLLSWEAGQDLPLVVSTGNQISSRILSMSAANALAILPSSEGRTEKILAVDEIIDVMLLGRA